ncbi:MULTISPECIES: hypothetical protein [Bradyrhizobium]|uniref:hypothetical protein n=1 Tax=Bradyrhizobium TaxID=374 RepID=UPI000231BD23|nr:hypothetical protein [Bradyrhizobium japonicum]MCS3988368.1 hypothetical protein [Bradyrhizobium japonicum]MCS4016815.1 hypothetical protein [Bradyrhizobium japonicum]BAL06173.1 hypothetical protein BJ6T_08800 [Bradyrhizobium japonicum USDA 6]
MKPLTEAAYVEGMNQNLTPTKWTALIVVKIQQNMENDQQTTGVDPSVVLAP